MQKFIQLSLLLTATVIMAACGSSTKEDNALTKKKAELEKLQQEQASLAEKIKSIQLEIAKLDPSIANSTAKLVNISTIANQPFVHYIDLQGKVDADNISYISPRLGPAQVKAVYVKQGDYVKRGQLLLKLDDVLVRQQLIAATKSMDALKTQLVSAKDIYKRQNNLWQQGIGTEIQVINIRTQVETLEAQLEGAKENVKVIEEQLKALNVYSDVDGIADAVNIRVGETFTGVTQAGPQISIVNTSSLKVTVQVPENYAGKIAIGTKALAIISDLNKTIPTTITLASKLINPDNRSFTAEMKIPYDKSVRPNQLAQVKIQDYAVASAVAIPVKTVQTDEKGKYVFVAVTENGKIIARKKSVNVGEMYSDLIEVRNGLTAGDQLIINGYQDLYDGQLIAQAK
jgi:membrane fusion protein, multidrug efflux system